MDFLSNLFRITALAKPFPVAGARSSARFAGKSGRERMGPTPTEGGAVYIGVGTLILIIILILLLT
jgi:hypothetical protein